MIISWITPKKESSDEPKASVSIQLFDTSISSSSWTSHPAASRSLPEENPYTHHSALIEKLEPDSLYLFQIDGFSVQHTFQTAPKNLEKPINFVVGGDTYKDEALFREINRQASATNPLFALIGGDLAYASPKSRKKPDDGDRWIAWLKCWYETMQIHTTDSLKSPSRLIPMITAIGNHDIKGRHNQTEKEAIFFYSLFRWPFLQKSYYTLRFSDYLSIYLLDSGHAFPIAGKQKKWLKEEMRKDQQICHKIAIYHIAAYPSIRPYRSPLSREIRKEWIPLFDAYKLNIAFENNDHAYKRTFRLKNSKPNLIGVVYIGDGSWGVEPRIPKKTIHTEYLEVTKMETQFCSVTLSAQSRIVVAIGSKGQEIDRYEEKIDL